MPVSTLTLTTEQVRDLVAELDGIALHARLLSLWAQTGIAPASVRHTGRRGRWNARLYNLGDVARVRLVARLRDAGMSMQQTRLALAYVEAQLPELLRRRSSASLHVDGWRGVIVERPGHSAQRVPSGQLLVPLSSVVVSERAAAQAAKTKAAKIYNATRKPKEPALSPSHKGPK